MANGVLRFEFEQFQSRRVAGLESGRVTGLIFTAPRETSDAPAIRSRVDGRRALLGLWCTQGIGSKAISRLEKAFGSLAALLKVPIAEWSPQVQLLPAAQISLSRFANLDEVAANVEAKLKASAIEVAFKGDEAYPPLLAEVADAAPLLFHWGPGARAPARRRLAMVGTRRPEQGFTRWAHGFAAQIAGMGIGVVSGAAEGVDQACHLGALVGKGETWAFLGSALDELDPAQARLWPRVRDGGGTFFSEFPPGARGDKSTFPRRNRLISGSADAVLVLRAPEDSGALHTARYAMEQGRPLLALPGDPSNPAAAGSNALLRAGHAKMCFVVADIAKVVGASGLKVAADPRRSEMESPLDSLSPDAQRAFSLLTKHGQDFDALYAQWGEGSGELSSALCELELAGWIVQRPGRRYEKI